METSHQFMYDPEQSSSSQGLSFPHIRQGIGRPGPELTTPFVNRAPSWNGVAL